jgi:hypothetical protein
VSVDDDSAPPAPAPAISAASSDTTVSVNDNDNDNDDEDSMPEATDDRMVNQASSLEHPTVGSGCDGSDGGGFEYVTGADGQSGILSVREPSVGKYFFFPSFIV